jgi:LytS/YehU family sensor histidine kinase
MKKKRRNITVQSGSRADTGWSWLWTLDSRRFLVLGFITIVWAVAVISLPHVLEGTPWREMAPKSAVMLLQMVVLTLGFRWMRNRNTGGVFILAAGVLVSILFGPLWVHVHAAPTMKAGVFLALSFGSFWIPVILFPAMVRDAKLRSLASERALRDAELAQLRSSLQPHFLMNTLHTVAALTVDEPLVARRLISALGDLLRDSLRSDSETRPLEADITWLQRYAEILETRHRGLLRFEWDIAPETMAVLIPKLLLQPLVENAAKHGALRRAEGGVVIVRARNTDTGLQLMVEDNGPGIAPGTKDGLGLRIVRERIHLGHPSASFRIESSSEWTRATIEIPVLQEVRS